MLSKIIILATMAQRMVAQSSISPSQVCAAIANDVASCWTNTNAPLTGAAVATCICTDGNGGVTTAFDDILTACQPYAATAAPDLNSALTLLSGYCANYAVAGGGGLAGGATTSASSARATGTTAPVTVATGIADECSAVQNILGSCYTNTAVAYTAPEIATCLCSDSTDANFGSTLDGAIATCYNYYRSVSADATTLAAFSALEGYCGSYYTGGGAEASETDTGIVLSSAGSTAGGGAQSTLASQASNSDDTSLVVVQPSATRITQATSVLAGLTSNAGNTATNTPATTTTSGNSGGTLGGKSDSSSFSFNVGTILFTASASILVLALAL